MSDWNVIGARRGQNMVSSAPVNSSLSQGVFSNRRVGVYAGGGRRLPTMYSQPSPPRKAEPTINFQNKDDFPSLNSSSSSSSNIIIHTVRSIPDFKAAANKGIQNEQIRCTMIQNQVQQPDIPIPVIRRLRPQVHRIDMSYDDPIEGGFSDDDDEIIRIKRKNHNESTNKFQSVTRMRIIHAQNFDSRNLDQEDIEKTNTPPYGPGPDDDF
jgi:hypothetical protein